MTKTIKQVSLESGINYSTLRNCWNYGCKEGSLTNIFEKLEAWDTLLNGALSNRSPARARELSTMEGFRAAVKRICPEINDKGRGRPRKNAEKND